MTDLSVVNDWIDAFEQRLAATSPVHRFAIQPEWIKAGRQGRLTGEILTAPALRRLAIWLEQKTGVPWDTSRVRIQEQASRDFGLASSLTPVLRSPEGESELVTELQAGEWVKVLGEANEHLLILSEDSARGWITASTLSERDREAHWETKSFLMGDVIPAPSSAQMLVARAQTFLDRPYVLGGKSEQGMDCSAFVQQVFLDITGHLLPRHSWDQKDYGMPVAANEVVPGDVVFGLSREQRRHVGLFLDREQVIHASRRAGKVAIWSREYFESMYQVVVIRRLIS